MPKKDKNQVIEVPIATILPNPNNPRVIEDDEFDQLVKSLQDFPDMLYKRPMICYTLSAEQQAETGRKYCVLGGNSRYQGLTKLKRKTVPIMLADDWSEEQRKEFVIKDNQHAGGWDYEALMKDWQPADLQNWGLDMPKFTPPKEQKAAPARQKILAKTKCPSCGHEFDVNKS